MEEETTPQSTNSPFILNKVYSLVIIIFEHYGWFLLAGGLLLYFFWTTKIEPFYKNWKDQKRQREYDEKYHKDPDLFISRQINLEKARENMQKRYDLKASEAEDKRKEKEEKKKQEWLAKQDPRLFGNRLNETISKSDYNPLMGPETRSYRPQRRTRCPNGGCG